MMNPHQVSNTPKKPGSPYDHLTRLGYQIAANTLFLDPESNKEELLYGVLLQRSCDDPAAV